MYPEKIHICAGGKVSFFSFPFCELTGEALNPRAGHMGCVAVCSPMCKFTYTFPPLACYSDNNEPFPYGHPFLKALLQPGPHFACLAPMNNPPSCCHMKNGVPALAPLPKRQILGCRGSQVLVPPLFPSPCRRQPRLPRCWAAVTGSPRCSLLWTLFFLAQRSPRHLKTESNSKLSWLPSSPLLPLPFLETVYE